MSCLKNIVSQNKQTEEGESSTGKKMELEAKRLGDNLEDSEIQLQEESDQEAVIEQLELEIPETVVPNQETSAGTNLDDYQLVKDRERRQVKPNLKYISSNLMKFVLVSGEALESVEPTSFEEAVNCENSESWKKAMREEIQSLNKNETWMLVEKPKNQKVIHCKWIYKLKGAGPKDPLTYKARLVAKGFTQREWIEYNEVFSPIIKYKTIMLVLALVV